jgi:hypothetical protein
MNYKNLNKELSKALKQSVPNSNYIKYLTDQIQKHDAINKSNSIHGNYNNGKRKAE